MNKTNKNSKISILEFADSEEIQQYLVELLSDIRLDCYDENQVLVLEKEYEDLQNGIKSFI